MRTGVWGPNWLKCGSDRGFSNLFQNKMKCEIDVLKKRSKRSVKFGQQGQSSHAQLNSYLSITKTLYFQNNCVPLILWNFNFCISTGRDKIWGWKGVARNKSFIILDASLDLPQCPGVTIISQWEASIRLWVTNERPGNHWPQMTRRGEINYLSIFIIKTHRRECWLFVSDLEHLCLFGVRCAQHSFTAPGQEFEEYLWAII